MSHALCLLLAPDVFIATIAIKMTRTRVTKQAAEQAAKKAAEQAAKKAAEQAAKQAAKKAAEQAAKKAAEQAVKQAAEQEAKQAAEEAAVPVLVQKRSSVRLHLTLACTRKPIRCATNTGIASSKHTRIGAKV